MKFKSNFLLTIVILCFVNIVSMAEELSFFSIEAFQKNALIIKLTNPSEGDTEVTIKDITGLTLYNETISQKTLNHRKYNLQNLPSGKYTMSVSYNSVIQIQQFEKIKGGISIKDEDLRTVFEPTFRQHSDYFDINMLCLSEMKISLKIKDNQGNVIYTETSKPMGTLSKRFNLSLLDGGSYTFTLGLEDIAVDKKFTESIEWSPSLVGL